MPRQLWLTVCSPVMVFLVNWQVAQAQEFSWPIKESQAVFQNTFSKFQLESKTLGGRQLWGDICFFHGYRIQQNVLTEHYRLIDPQDVRKQWGSLAQCEEELQKIADAKQLKPMTGRAVVLVHGIVRSSKSMAALADSFESAGYVAVRFDYPSTRITMDQSTEFLDKTIQSLTDVKEINLVGMSMGGLLIRSYLKRTEKQPEPRIHRCVMLGTPNQGAEMANMLKTNLAFKWIFGPAGQELVTDPNGTIAQLPIPACEFAIIAGARGTPHGWNPLIPGDDDGTIPIESTYLAGARDFMTVKSLHSFIASNPESIKAVECFLETGALRESGVRVPIDDVQPQNPQD